MVGEREKTRVLAEKLKAVWEAEAPGLAGNYDWLFTVWEANV